MQVLLEATGAWASTSRPEKLAWQGAQAAKGRRLTLASPQSPSAAEPMKTVATMFSGAPEDCALTGVIGAILRSSGPPGQRGTRRKAADAKRSETSGIPEH